MIPWIIKNHNMDKIEVVEEYDEKCNVMRVDVREKTHDSSSTKGETKGCGEQIRNDDSYGWINCGDILDEDEKSGKVRLCNKCQEDRQYSPPKSDLNSPNMDIQREKDCPKGVYIERAEPLTTEGIKAICMDDKDYEEHCKNRNVKDRRSVVGGKD